MKKTGFLFRAAGALLLVVMLVPALCSAYAEHSSWDCPNCGRTGNTGNFCGGCGAPAPELSADPAWGMTHEEYAAAGLDTEVCVETYVQATQEWWNESVVVYAQSPDGAYLLYNLHCSAEDSKRLVPGACIRVRGCKSEWMGEIEIIDGTFEIVDGKTFIAEAFDATDLLGKEELINHQNERVLFRGLTVEAQDDGQPISYKNPVDKTDDLYFRASKDGKTYDFCVEFYLCGNDTEVYKAVEALKVGDVIDIEAYLYWYIDMNPHAILVTNHTGR